MPPTAAAPTGRSSITWQSPDGSVWDLTAPPTLWVLPGIVGFGVGPRAVVSDDLPQGYALYRSTVPGPRTITLPLHLHADDMASFLATRNALFSSLTATGRLRAPGQLVVTRPDGSSRQIDCFYSAGLEGDADRGLPRQTWPVQLWAPFPWYSADQQSLSFPYFAGPAYLGPYETVSPSTSLGQADVYVQGGLPTPPLWWFDGPFSAVTATSGAGSFTLTRACAAGERWTVNTDPQQLSATSSDGTNLMPFLNWPAGQLWRLQPGANRVSTAMTGAQPGTVATLAYQTRWDAP